MPTILTGQVNTKGDVPVNSDRLVVDMLSKIYTLDPQSTPMLTVLTQRGRTMPAKATTVQHLEDEPVPEWDTENGGGINSSATSLTVSNGSYHRAGDILYNPTSGEGVRVTAVASNVLTITRGYVGSAASIASGANLLNLGGAEQEGSTAPEAKHTKTVTKSNYTQILRESVHLSRTLDQVNLYGGKERARQRRKAGAKHSRDAEQILIWGQKKEDTTTAGTPIRLMGGLNEHITTNELDVSSTGILAESDLRDFIGDVFRYKVDGGGGRKALIASRPVIDTMESWGASKLQTSPGGSKYGFQIRQYVSTYGTLDVVYHPLLEVGTAGYAFIVDMAGVMLRPLQRTILKTNIQQNDEDGYKDEYLSEQSASFINEEAFGRIKGVSYS